MTAEHYTINIGTHSSGKPVPFKTASAIDPLEFLQDMAANLGISQNIETCGYNPFNPVMDGIISDHDGQGGLYMAINANRTNAPVRAKLFNMLSSDIVFDPNAEGQKYSQFAFEYSTLSQIPKFRDRLDFLFKYEVLDDDLNRNTSPYFAVNVSQIKEGRFIVSEVAHQPGEIDLDFMGIHREHGHDYTPYLARLLEYTAGVSESEWKDNWALSMYGEKASLQSIRQNPLAIRGVADGKDENGVPIDPISFTQFAKERVGIEEKSFHYINPYYRWNENDPFLNHMFEKNDGASHKTLRIDIAQRDKSFFEEDLFVDFGEYADGKNNFDAIAPNSFDISKHTMEDFGKFSEYLGVAFRYEDIANLAFKGIEVYDHGSGYEQMKLPWKKKRASDHFSNLGRDYRATVFRMFELFADIPESNWNAPGDFSAHYIPTDQDQQIDAALHSLFSKSQAEELQSALIEARLKIRDGYLSVPKLGIGMTNLPNTNPTLEHIALLEPAALLVHQLHLFGIMQREEAIASVAQQFTNQITSGSYQLSRESAGSVLKDLEATINATTFK